METPPFEKVIIDLPGLKFMTKAAIHKLPLHNQREGCWESIYDPTEVPDVMVAGMTSDNKLILIRVFRFPVENWVIELPGGTPLENESYVSAAKREFLEEVGYSSDEQFEELTRGWVYNGKSNKSFVIYFARNCKKIKEPNRDAVEIFAGLEVLEQTPKEIMNRIAQSDIAYDPPISHALISLLEKGLIRS